MLVGEMLHGAPVALTRSSTARTAAKAMRDNNIGDVLVVDRSGALAGIVTDRDLAVRVLAEGRNPASVKLDQICSHDVAVLEPSDAAEAAIVMMRDRGIRRLPVVDGARKPVGVVSLGDLARQMDPDSALADISQAPPNL